MPAMIYWVNRRVDWPEWFMNAWIFFMLACAVALLAMAIGYLMDKL